MNTINSNVGRCRNAIGISGDPGNNPDNYADLSAQIEIKKLAILAKIEAERIAIQGTLEYNFEHSIYFIKQDEIN